MKKKLLSLILIPILSFVFIFPVLAEELPHFIDNAGLLSDEEDENLNEYALNVSEEVQMDVVVLSVDTMEGKTSEEYADDYYDYNGYGQGDTKDGILFLIDMDTRAWAISTTGHAINVFSDRSQEEIMDEVLPYLSDGEYYDAFARFITGCYEHITDVNGGIVDEAIAYDEETGEYYDTSTSTYSSSHHRGINIGRILVSLAFGFFIASLIVGAWKKKLLNVGFKSGASDYLKPGSFCLSVQKDVYLYRTVVRTPKPKDNGGSSTHVGGSGTTHGGSHGHF